MTHADPCVPLPASMGDFFNYAIKPAGKSRQRPHQLWGVWCVCREAVLWKTAAFCPLLSPEALALSQEAASWSQLL